MRGYEFHFTDGDTGSGGGMEKYFAQGHTTIIAETLPILPAGGLRGHGISELKVQ